MSPRKQLGAAATGVTSIPGPHRHRISDRREEGLVKLPFCFASLPTIVGKISTWNIEPRVSVFKSAFDSQNPAVSPGCVSLHSQCSLRKIEELEGERKRKPLTLRRLSARGRRLKASRWKVLGHDMDSAVLCCGSNHTSQGVLLLLDRPSSTVLFLFSSLQVHVDDKLGDHGAGWRYFSFSRQRALWPWVYSPSWAKGSCVHRALCFIERTPWSSFPLAMVHCKSFRDSWIGCGEFESLHLAPWWCLRWLHWWRIKPVGREELVSRRSVGILPLCEEETEKFIQGKFLLSYQPRHITLPPSSARLAGSMNKVQYLVAHTHIQATPAIHQH